MSAFAAICALLLGAAVLLWLPRQLPAHLGVLGSAAAAEPVPAEATGIDFLLRRLRRRDAAAEASEWVDWIRQLAALVRAGQTPSAVFSVSAQTAAQAVAPSGSIRAQERISRSVAAAASLGRGPGETLRAQAAAAGRGRSRLERTRVSVLRDLARCWEVSERTGAPLASLLEGVAEAARRFEPTQDDLDASGLRRRGGGSGSAPAESGDEGESEEEAEARREERRRVIANNKAWASAETVRREWLATFVARKTAPKGAEALICEAVVTGHHSLSKAMDHRHPMLFTLLGVDRPTGYYGAGHDECHKIATKASTPKAATMTTLAAVVAAWEATTGKHSWRNPTAWDARVLGALVEWGYQPSEVERILLGEEPQPSTEDDSDADAAEASDEASDSAA